MPDSVIFTVIKTGKGMQLALSGVATIQQSEEIKQAFLSCLKETGDVVLDIAGLTRVDSSFFQMLCALEKSLVAQNRTLQLVGSGCSSVEAYAERIGFFSPSLGLFQPGEAAV